jgi:hypothetical protein
MVNFLKYVQILPSGASLAATYVRHGGLAFGTQQQQQ